jgi:hypothetical protein
MSQTTTNNDASAATTAQIDVSEVTNTKLTKMERETLQACIIKLKALCDVNNTSCGVEKKHKEGVRLYLDSWVIPQLEALAKDPKTRSYEEVQTLLWTGRNLWMDIKGAREHAKKFPGSL